MGNRAVITLEDQLKRTHPVAVYVHWHGGLESVLAFIQYTWDTFPRGRDDLFTFHARLCQVIGNFFPDGLSLYGHPSHDVHEVADGCDNGHWHFQITAKGYTLINRKADLDAARQHEYWKREHSILAMIKGTMPTQDSGHHAKAGTAPTDVEAVP